MGERPMPSVSIREGRFVLSKSLPYKDFSECRLIELQKEAERKEDFEKCRDIQEELISRINLSDLL